MYLLVSREDEHLKTVNGNTLEHHSSGNSQQLWAVLWLSSCILKGLADLLVLSLLLVLLESFKF